MVGAAIGKRSQEAKANSIIARPPLGDLVCFLGVCFLVLTRTQIKPNTAEWQSRQGGEQYPIQVGPSAGTCGRAVGSRA